jgi:hypothetical protein
MPGKRNPVHGLLDRSTPALSCTGPESGALRRRRCGPELDETVFFRRGDADDVPDGFDLDSVTCYQLGPDPDAGRDAGRWNGGGACRDARHGA